jgi:hypothetical protein
VIGDLDRDIQGDAECHRDDIQTRQQWMPSEVAQDVPAKEEEILRGQVSTADDAEKIVGRELVYLLVVAETSFRRGLRHRSNRHIAVGEVYKSRCAIGSLCRDPISIITGMITLREAARRYAGRKDRARNRAGLPMPVDLFPEISNGLAAL